MVSIGYVLAHKKELQKINMAEEWKKNRELHNAVMKLKEHKSPFYLMIPLIGFSSEEEIDQFEVVFCYDGSTRILRRNKEILKI